MFIPCSEEIFLKSRSVNYAALTSPLSYAYPCQNFSLHVKNSVLLLLQHWTSLAGKEGSQRAGVRECSTS